MLTFDRILLLCLRKNFVLFFCLIMIYMVTFQISFGMGAPDSLINAVKNSNGTSKVDALNSLAEYTIRFSVKDAEKLLDQARSLSTELGYKFGTAKSFQFMANLYGNKGDNEKAVAFAEKAAALFGEIKEDESVFNCIEIQGSNYNALGNNSKGIDCYIKALHMAEKLKRIDFQSSTSSLLCQCFIKLDDRINALDYASKALLLSRKMKDARVSGMANIAMANFLSTFGVPENAKIFFLKAIRAFLNSKNPYSLASGYVQFGNHFVKTNEYDSALVYYNKALQINIETSELMTQASSLTFIAHVYQLKLEYPKALQYQLKALQLRKEYGNLWLTGSSYCNAGTVYTKMQDFQKASQYFYAGLEIAEAIKRIDYIKYTYQRLCDLYLTQQNFKKALECNLIVSSINDSILKAEIQQRFVEIKDKQDNERKQRAIAFLTKENEIQKLSLKQISLAIYVMTISLFLLTIIGVLLIFQARLKARHKQMDIEQNLLRSQMNPHFIFNALIAIQSFIYKKNSSEAARYLTNFARLIRLVLSNSQEEFVTLKREIDTLSNYLSLQKLRFDDKFDYSLIIDPEINTENIKIPPMLAQPFVENAIEHGILGLDAPGRIMINFSFVNNSVIIEITDNGIGREKGREMRKKTDKSHESYGTRITEERIHSHNRKYSNKLRLVITDLFDENNKAAGTKVVLSIPNHVE